MQVVLVMFRSDGERRSFPLQRHVTVIGRREDCDLRIPLGEVSRKHCRVVKDGDSIRLEDLGSSNGTYHNGNRVQEIMLQAGDSVQVGPVIFVVQMDGVPADDQMNPIGKPPATEGVPAEEAPHSAETLEPAPDAAPGEFDPMSALEDGVNDSGEFDIQIEEEVNVNDSGDKNK